MGHLAQCTMHHPRRYDRKTNSRWHRAKQIRRRPRTTRRLAQRQPKRTGSDMQFWRHRPASAKAALKCWYLPSLRSRGSAYLQNPIEHQKAQDLPRAFSFVLQRIQSGTGSNMGKRCRAYDTTIQADRGHIQHFLANHLPEPPSRSSASKSF